MSFYCLVPKEEITNNIINRSVYKNIESIPLHNDCYIIEFEKFNIKLTNAFDDYLWLNKDELLNIIQGDL
jgi:hypothetical protein